MILMTYEVFLADGSVVPAVTYPSSANEMPIRRPADDATGDSSPIDGNTRLTMAAIGG